MYHFENMVMRDRRGRALKTIGDWDHPSEKGDIPFAVNPTLRQALLHFVEVLPRSTVDAQGRQTLGMQELILRDRIATALSHDGTEVEWFELEDEHRNRIVKWFEAFAPQVFGPDLVPISNALDKGKLGKAPQNGNARIGNRNEAGSAGGRENDDRLVAAARNGNDREHD